MVIALRVEVNVIAVCVLLLLIQNKRRLGKNMLDERLYRLLICATLVYAAADTIAWVLDGTRLDSMHIPLYVVNIICYLSCVIVPYIWLLYAEFRLFADEDQLRKTNRIFALPVVIYSVLVIATPLTGWMFSFDENQMYQRGMLFPLQVVLSLFYVIYPTIRALMRLKTATVASERQEYRSIAVFALFPLAGLVIQVMFYGIPAAIGASAIAELMIFINVQNKQISLDALTSLNNRGQLNRYLSIQTKKESRHENLYMLLLDIDRFKQINDTYGHKIGDQALIDMSMILQRVCGKKGGFLARYGGDEFAIVIEKKTSDELEDLIQHIQTEVEAFNDAGNRQYQLSISAGYAQYETKKVKTIDQLIEAADNAMYQMKEKRHAGIR